MITLGERLRLIETLVPDGAAVCDVGTDHGYLPAALCLGGRASSVIATDIHEKPLAAARAHLEKYGAHSVKLRCCDGLAGVSRSEVDTVIIAGMGGEVISGILDRCPYIKDAGIMLLLQPMTSAELLRDYLAQNAFRVLAEPAVIENGRVFAVMQVRYDGVPRSLSPAARFIGAVEADYPAGRAYIKKQYRRCRECAQSIAQIPGRETLYMTYQTAVDEMRMLLGEENNGV